MTKELLLHLKQHNQKRKCNKCRWATFYRKWATALPLVPPTLEHEPELLQGWTELHDKEAAFQQSKREKRKFEALAYGALLPDECSEEFKEAAHKVARSLNCVEGASTAGQHFAARPTFATILQRQ